MEVTDKQPKKMPSGRTIRYKIGIMLLLVWTLTVTVLRAARLPNDFAKAHWLLDYRFGFVKRGLIGTIVSLFTELFHIPITEQLISVLSYTAFSIYCIVLIAVSFRIIHKSDWSDISVLISLIFFSSPFIVISAHLVGYYDNMIITLAVFSIVLLLKNRIWLAALFQTVSIFIHEITLLFCFPLFFTAWRLSDRHPQKGTFVRFLPLLLPLSAFGVIAVGSVVFMEHDFKELFTEHLSRFAFIGDNRNVLAPEWLATTFFEHFRWQHMKFIARISSAEMHGLVLPTALPILCYTASTYRIRIFSTESVVLLGACFAPQLMHAVAWDTPRIWTYTILCSFLVLWIYAEFSDVHKESEAMKLLCLIAIIANILVVTPLMNNRVDYSDMKIRLLMYAPVMVASLIFVHRSDHAERR